MGSPLEKFISHYPTIPVLAASLLIFYSGYIDLRKGKRSAGTAWCIMGISILLAYSTTVIYFRMWSGLIAVLLVLAIEIVVARSVYRTGGSKPKP